MKRLFKLLFMALLVVGAAGYGVYHFGTNVVSSKVVEKISTELEQSGKLDEVKRAVSEDPRVKQFAEEGMVVDEKTIPFTTKEEATRVLIQKVGAKELYSLQDKAKKGMSKEEQQQAIHDIESKLTEEEISAMKYVLYKELSE